MSQIGDKRQSSGLNLSQDGRTRLSAKQASETDAEELEPGNSERPNSSNSSSGVVIPSLASSCDFEFGEDTVQMSTEKASIQVSNAFRHQRARVEVDSSNNTN